VYSPDRVLLEVESRDGGCLESQPRDAVRLLMQRGHELSLKLGLNVPGECMSYICMAHGKLMSPSLSVG